MKIEFEAKLPADMSQREKDALLDALLGEMTTSQIARTVFEMCGSNIAPLINALDADQ